MLEDVPEEKECRQSVLDVLLDLMRSKIAIRFLIMICIFGVAPNVSTNTLNEIFFILG